MTSIDLIDFAAIGESFLYCICLISIGKPVSDGATNKSVLNIERSSSTINHANEYEPDVVNQLGIFVRHKQELN